VPEITPNKSIAERERRREKRKRIVLYRRKYFQFVGKK